VQNALLECNAPQGQLRLNLGRGTAFATVAWVPAVGGADAVVPLNYPGNMLDFSNMLRNQNIFGDQVTNCCGYLSNVEISGHPKTDHELLRR